VYRDSTAVLGPLAAYEEPHCYDLCEKHAARLVVPRGWDVVRLPRDPAQERADDLEALANVVREPRRAATAPAAAPAPAPAPAVAPRQPGGPRQGGQAGRGPGAPVRPNPAEPVGQGVEVSRRGHLRVVRSVPSES
jgi:hypothetical protein